MGFVDLTVKEANAIALGQKGRLTITDTNIHYGRYAALFMLEDTVFAASGLVDSVNQLANGFAFTDSATTEIVVGDCLRGATSGAIVQVRQITITSGSWAGGNAAGWMIAEPVNTTGTVAAEVMDLITLTAIGNGTYPYTVKTASVLTLASEANGGVTTGDTQIGETYPKGSVLYGLFTKIDLASGALEAYKA